MRYNFFINKKIKYFFKTIHSFGYYKGYDPDNNDFIIFSNLPKKQQVKIVKTNLKIFKNPDKYTYADFKDIQLIYLGENLLE